MNEQLKDQVLRKIEEGKISMKPKAYFVFKVILLGTITVITFIITAVLVSYIIFSLKTGGHLFLLGFGARGIYKFLLLFPWVLFIIDAILLLFLDWLLKQFKFGYHSPIIYLFLVSLALITVFGSLIDVTSFHRGLLREAEASKLPFAGGLYDGLRKSHRKIGIFMGEVTSVSTSTFFMDYDDYDTPWPDGNIEVIAPTGFHVILVPKDEVFVAGDMINGEIHAYGIRKIVGND